MDKKTEGGVLEKSSNFPKLKEGTRTHNQVCGVALPSVYTAALCLQANDFSPQFFIAEKMR